MKPSSVTELLFKQLNYRAENQKVIATNIANLDTPGFKTKSLQFKNELEKSQEKQSISLNTTHSNHIQMAQLQGSGRNYRLEEVKDLPEQNDGNNVNLDTQMSQMSQNNVMFSALQNSIKKDSMWFKTVIDSSSKN